MPKPNPSMVTVRHPKPIAAKKRIAMLLIPIAGALVGLASEQIAEKFARPATRHAIQ